MSFCTKLAEDAPDRCPAAPREPMTSAASTTSTVANDQESVFLDFVPSSDIRVLSFLQSTVVSEGMPGELYRTLSEEAPRSGDVYIYLIS